MSDDDQTDQQKAREETDDKGLLEAARDEMADLKDQVKDAVTNDDEGDDGKPAEPGLYDEPPRADEEDANHALGGDRPSERTKSQFNRK